MFPKYHKMIYSAPETHALAWRASDTVDEANPSFLFRAEPFSHFLWCRDSGAWSSPWANEMGVAERARPMREEAVQVLRKIYLSRAWTRILALPDTRAPAT